MSPLPEDFLHQKTHHLLGYNHCWSQGYRSDLEEAHKCTLLNVVNRSKHCNYNAHIHQMHTNWVRSSSSPTFHQDAVTKNGGGAQVELSEEGCIDGNVNGSEVFWKIIDQAYSCRQIFTVPLML